MQFSVYRNPSAWSQDRVPYLLDVQADLLDELATRVVIPLVRRDYVAKPMQILNPVFTVEQQEVVLSTAEIAGVPVKALGERVGTLAAQRGTVVAALDFLLTGI
jgi:toxin CcdB